MKTVPGPSDRVVVVGAGFAGLAAALHLAGRGHEVTVVERENWPGGRAGRLDVDGYRLDTGPTVLTMPDIIDETFAAVGESSSARMELLDVDPAYRAQFADGSSIDVHSDADRMAAAIEEFAGAKQAAGYRQLRDWLTRLYQIEFDGFIARNFDSPLSLLNPQLAKLAAIGGFRNWDAMVKRHITDPRLRRVFTFQSLYAGVAPRQALAVYAVIAYMDTVSGVLFPRGGMRALPDALAAAAIDAGVQFHYGATVTGLECTGGRVAAVHTDQDQRLACDAAVLTSELPQTYTLLGREPRRVGSLRPAPSAVVVHIGSPSRQSANRPLAHHNIVFGAAWEETFTDIIRDGRLMRDPSLLVTRPTAGDPYVDQLLDVVAARLVPGLREGAKVLHVVNPVDWARQGMVAGTPFALAHTFAQTGPFRPANTVRGIDNAVLAGSSTVPGVGVPTALISGRLAADRITGIVEKSNQSIITRAGLS